MNAKLPSRIDPDAAVFSVSVAAQLADMHAQTLRSYDRLGLVVPTRTASGRRRYSPRDVARLRIIGSMANEGINIVGITRILELQDQVETLQSRNQELADLLSEIMARSQEHRVFTATTAGNIFHGRIRRTIQAIGR